MRANLIHEHLHEHGRVRHAHEHEAGDADHHAHDVADLVTEGA